MFANFMLRVSPVLAHRPGLCYVVMYCAVLSDVGLCYVVMYCAVLSDVGMLSLIHISEPTRRS